jgi:cytochrome b6-f complex iron-sulfur subunit
MDRKEFITTCGSVCMGAATMAWLQSCTTQNYYAMASKSEKKLVIKKSEFIKTEKDKNTERKYILVKTEELNFPICIYKMGVNTYSALLMECTHKSCELQPHGDYLVCPCHGSEFTKQGLVQNPPAEQDLRTFKISSDDEYIYLHL